MPAVADVAAAVALAAAGAALYLADRADVRSRRLLREFAVRRDEGDPSGQKSPELERLRESCEALRAVTNGLSQRLDKLELAVATRADPVPGGAPLPSAVRPSGEGGLLEESIRVMSQCRREGRSPVATERLEWLPAEPVEEGFDFSRPGATRWSLRAPIDDDFPSLRVARRPGGDQGILFADPRHAATRAQKLLLTQSESGMGGPEICFARLRRVDGDRWEISQALPTRGLE